MKNLTFYLIVIILFSSCSGTWHLNRAKYKSPELFTEKIDTIINLTRLDTTIFLDTLINVILPRDTVKIDSLVFKTLKPSFNVITKKNGIITENIWMNKGRLYSETYLDSALWYQYQDSIRVKDAKIYELRTINTKQTVTIKNQETKLKTFLNWIKWIGISLGVLIVLAVLYKLYKWIRR